MTAFYIIITHPIAPHNLPKPHYPLLCTITLASLVKGEVLSPIKNSGDYRRDCLTIIPRLHQPFQNRTIPLAFRRVRSSLLPLHLILPSPTTIAKEHLSLALLAPPVVSTLSVSTTIAKGQQPFSPHNLPKPHHPLLCTTFLPYERSVGFASHCLVSH